MDQVQNWLSWLSVQRPNWDLILRFTDVLVWPLTVWIGILAIKPGRIIAALLDGGELGLGPATMKFAKRVEEISSSVDQDEETRPNAGAEVVNPLQEAADPYTTVLNAWGKVIEGLEEAVRRGDLERLDKRNPMDTVVRLRRANLIGRKLEGNIQALWDFRNKVVRAGSRRVERLGLTQVQADEYYSTADRVRRGIINALKYRESIGILPSTHAAPGGADLAMTPPAHLN